MPGRYTEQQNRDKQSDAHVWAQPFKETFHRVYLALLLHDKFEARQASDSIIDTSKNALYMLVLRKQMSLK